MANILKRNFDAGPLSRGERSWDPAEGLQDLMRWDPFRDFGFPLAPQRELGFLPSFDVKETHDAFVFKADLPGIKESEVDISLTGNRLSVSGKREEENRQESDRYFSRPGVWPSRASSVAAPKSIWTVRANASCESSPADFPASASASSSCHEAGDAFKQPADPAALKLIHLGGVKLIHPKLNNQTTAS